MISHWYTHAVKVFRGKSPQHDPQKNNLYRMEREFIGHAVDTRVPAEKLQLIANHACRKRGVKPPKVKTYRGIRRDARVFGWCDHECIHLNEAFHGCNTSCLLHELAHWLTPEDHDSHGPEFCGIYRELLDQYKMLPKVAFDALSKKHGVKVKHE